MGKKIICMILFIFVISIIGNILFYSDKLFLFVLTAMRVNIVLMLLKKLKNRAVKYFVKKVVTV